MSNVCCKEFTGWFKSFTKAERALTVLEVALLAVLVTLLILLILHLIACSKPGWQEDLQPTTDKVTTNVEQEDLPGLKPAHVSDWDTYDEGENFNSTTYGPDVNCTWTPSVKTTARIHYYEHGHTHKAGSKISKVHKTTMNPNAVQVPTKEPKIVGNIGSETVKPEPTSSTTQSFEDLIREELSDGEEAEHEYDKYVLALVKLKPPKDIIFGCILTIVSEYWTLTAASCIEAIEEMDSLDSFVMIENYGLENTGPVQPVDDVQIHPLYEGKNRTYDLAAIKSAKSFIGGPKSLIELTSFLEFALLSLAERFIILGYGAFRSIESGPGGRRLRQAHVYSLPVRQCAGDRGEGEAALRHLSGGRAVSRGACASPALCAGVLHSRGLPCNYCAGTPLLVGAPPSLLALMADSEQCGVTCEGALYVNLADPDIADWVDATLRSHLLH